MTEEIHVEKYVINILSQLFQLNYQIGHFLKTDQKIRPTDQSANMTLKTDW